MNSTTQVTPVNVKSVENGYIVYADMVGNKYDGSYEMYDEETSELVLIGQYKNNLRDGKWVEFWDNKQIKSMYHFVDGKYSGLWTTWSYEGDIIENIIV